MKKVLFIIIIFIHLSFYGQKETICHTPSITDWDNMQELINLNIANSSGFIDQSDMHALVKIYVHVIRRTDGTGGQTTYSTNQAINILRADYCPVSIYFDWDDTIDFIDNTSFFNSPSPSIFNVNNHSDGIDIYLFDDNAPSGGLANGVGISSEYYVSGSYWNYPNGSLITSHVISHEMGHVLSSWHTHHGTYNEGGDTSQCPELVDGTNSYVCGDYISDTPADPHIHFNVNSDCVWTASGAVDANGDLYDPDTNNIMSYSSPDCMSYFSDQQGYWMLNALNTIPFLQDLSSIGYGAIDINAIDCGDSSTSLTKSVNVFPNPTDDLITLSFNNLSEMIEVSVKDKFGKSIYHDFCNEKSITINTETFESGIYFIEIKEGEKIHIEKIIIQH
jgi:hypothetical protein